MLGQKAILIIDDDTLIREQLEKELKRNFFTTFSAGNGKDAFAILERENIDILLLDIMLPDTDGFEILTKVKEQKTNCEVIVITGFGTQEVAIKSLRKGAIDYIEKPIKMDELTTAIGRAQEKLIEKENLAHKNTLLVIDDDEETVKRLKRFLENEDFNVLTAVNGKQGLAIAENNKIDVIITDIKMDDMDGIEVLKRAKELYQDIDGIMVTGYKDQDMAIKALRAGAIDYLTKPLNLDELLFSINRATERIHLKRNYLYRNRELKITSEIISKMNEELERRMEQKAKEFNQVQAQLFQTSKLATLGEMAAGLAHEMNQPLAGISLVTKYLSKMLVAEKLDRAELELGMNDIENSVHRMSRIIHHIRTFARQDTMKFIQVNVNQTIDSALSLLGEQLRLHEIELELDCDPDLPLITGEPYQLEQVWINMITNARDAVDEKQRRIERGEPAVDRYAKKIVIATRSLPEKMELEVVFTDNGIGIPDDIKEKILEPFFTTKEVGKATGLGLSISYGIIENHGGRIAISSREGHETSVTVTLKTGVLDGKNSDY